MSENTRRLLGDPEPGRTPWARPAEAQPKATVKVIQRQATAHAEEVMERVLAESDSVAPTAARRRPGKAERAALSEVGIPTSEEKQQLGTPQEPQDFATSHSAADMGNPITEQDQGVEPVPLTDNLRRVAPIDVSHLDLKRPPTGEPIFERVDPRDLLVDGNYQRDLSPASLKLIERIAQNWDWRRFKPPVVAFADGGLQIIDGQHTSIAAASRIDITAIPVMVVEAAAIEARAGAFIGHNKDRLGVTAMQLHHAAVAAGDVDALAIENACKAAGVRIVRSPYGTYKYKLGETIAIAAVGALIRGHGVAKTEALLKVLVAAGLAPIRVEHIKAVELLFSDPDYRENLEPMPEGGADVAAAIRTLGDQAAKDAKLFAAAQAVPVWRALAIGWFRKARKRRKTA